MWTYNTETKYCLNIFEKVADDELTIKYDPKFVSGRVGKCFQPSEAGNFIIQFSELSELSKGTTRALQKEHYFSSCHYISNL